MFSPIIAVESDIPVGVTMRDWRHDHERTPRRGLRFKIRRTIRRLHAS